jgi:hypothetical protein
MDNVEAGDEVMVMFEVARNVDYRIRTPFFSKVAHSNPLTVAHIYNIPVSHTDTYRCICFYAPQMSAPNNYSQFASPAHVSRVAS